ncbi:hypothetical protein NVIRPANT_00681 [Pantoea sp. Nvir]|nr:hypothetical protein NVIRPANT_00681 [Pantoea sp. Nvir]
MRRTCIRKALQRFAKVQMVILLHRPGAQGYHSCHSLL